MLPWSAEKVGWIATVKINKVYLIINIAVTVFLVTAEIYSYNYAASDNGPDRLFREAIFFFLNSFFIFLAYDYSRLSVIFKLIRWICENLSFPRGGFMIYVYSACFFAVGIIQAIRWIFSDT